MKKGIKKGLSVITSTVLVLGCLCAGSVFAATELSMDGDTSDWSAVKSQTVNGGNEVSEWKVASDNDNLYIMYTGTATNVYDYEWTRDKNILTIRGSSKTDQLQVAYDGSGISVLQDGWKSRPDIQHGFTMKATNDWNSAKGPSGPYVVEMTIPKAQYGDSVTVGFAGTTVASADIPDLSSVEPAASSETPAASSAAPAASSAEAKPTTVAPAATYNGISIDGDMSDWAAVAKVVPADDRVKEVAAIWDGDYLYIYAKSGDWGSVAWSGPNGNGKFAIKSDLGYTELIQFKNNPATLEGKDVSYKVNGDEWEIAIPKSSLPNYTKYLNFGFYLGDTLIADIQNLDGSSNEDIKPGEMILDGSYEEWEQYPHAIIEYDTAGTNEMKPDAQGAMYMDGDKIYGHVTTNIPSLLSRSGGEFNYARMMFNSADPANDYNNQQWFGWKLFSLDPSGNVKWEDSNNLSAGTHRFYVTASQSWGNNINDENKNLPIFGEIVMTVGQGDRDDMEFCMDTKEIANYFNVSAGDLRIASVYYTDIGREWISVAGTSTGPVLGIIICIAVVGTTLIIKRRRTDGRLECLKA